MTRHATTTTPDPELYLPDEKPEDAAADKTAAQPGTCPQVQADSAQADSAQAQAAQQPGGGGAPNTGGVDISVSPSPGEGVTEEQIQRSGLPDRS